MEENFSELPNEIFENALKELIRARLQTDDYELKISAGSKKGDNALGIVYRVQVVVKDHKKLSLILKVSPQNIARREQFFTHDIFERESNFYNEIYPMYKSFQEMKGIDIRTEGFHEIARCYKTFSDEPFEGQIFEDLKEKGFELFDRTKSLSNEHVLLAMKALAKKHAIFLSIKDQKPELVEKYKNMEDMVVKIMKAENSTILTWHKTQSEQALEALKNCENKDLITRVKRIIKDDALRQFEEALCGKDAEPYSVLCHGDCWNNNVMYKNDQNGNPKEIRLLDFQLMRYASPATDVSYYIFGCTTKAMRDKHYGEYLDIYYDTLKSFMGRLGSDPDKIFPRHAFDDQMKKFAKWGLIMGVMLVAAFIGDNNDRREMDELCEGGDKFSFISKNTASVYETRMMEVFQDMYEMGYI